MCNIMVSICVNVAKCPVKCKRESPFFNTKVRVCVQDIFWLRFGVTLFASLRSTVSTLHDLYCLCFSPQAVMVKLRRRVSGHQLSPEMHVIRFQ